jgi:hypothetical protein
MITSYVFICHPHRLEVSLLSQSLTSSSGSMVITLGYRSLCAFFFFSHTVVWTQGLTLAKQVLYHSASHIYFQNIILPFAVMNKLYPRK